MKAIVFSLLFILSTHYIQAQSPVGNWKKISHTVEMNGQKIETHAALRQQRPCVSKIVYEIKEDASFRLNAAAAGCDEKYRNIQEKLYSKTQWKVVGDKISTSSSNFSISQTYVLSFSSNTMTWVGTEGQGTIVYQKL